MKSDPKICLAVLLAIGAKPSDRGEHLYDFNGTLMSVGDGSSRADFTPDIDLNDAFFAASQLNRLVSTQTDREFSRVTIHSHETADDNVSATVFGQPLPLAQAVCQAIIKLAEQQGAI